MLEALVIALREGIEAFLIVAITLAYLRKTGRAALAPAVYIGTGLALVLSITAALLLREMVVTPLYEGLLALVAAILVITMLVYMTRAAKHLRSDIGQRIEAAAARQTGAGAFLAIAGFTLLMITREGMETAFMITSLMGQTDTTAMTVGALLGVLLAAALAWGWSRYGQRINLGRFFQVTTIFLGLFIMQLALYAFHEFTEAGVLPLDNAYWHVATEPYAEGQYGVWLSYALVLIPLGWLVLAFWRDRAAMEIRQ
jgi:high-affinity iron transporter